MHAETAERILAGETRAAARLISRLEDGDPEAYRVLDSLKRRTGDAQVIGVTGPPGSGKSTLTDKMIGVLRARGLKVGVVAVDPSSPFSGGAILGDRLRMQGHATDPGVFIRSLASRGMLGGLTRATAASVRVLEALGCDVVIVETVGVGQSEIDIARLADTVVLVSVPGLGDDIQVIKAGIMEIGDIFVVNKSDRDGADRVVREIRAMLETQSILARGKAVSGGPDTLAARLAEVAHHGMAASGPAREADDESVPCGRPATGEAPGPGKGQGSGDGHADLPPLPPVMKTVAETGQGVAELVDAVLAHHERAIAAGILERRRLGAVKMQLRDLAAAAILRRLSSGDGAALVDRLAGEVQAREREVFGAADELLARIVRGGWT